jgi:hypothetical protein
MKMFGDGPFWSSHIQKTVRATTTLFEYWLLSIIVPEHADICGSLEDCQNSFGSYECVCKTGYEKAADGTCQGE